ncbi:M16 family metallopeptidase [Paenibacillus popilliae]|uniref:Insulinase family protein n=1 Tax=Paenibacillus popilliae TaxID=78057 RepID=A0ABY3AR65_PAEPP|nr:pitrilysin family protein [Paenibacillus sp. SDF0028]TQR45125.1 insulinase family protein [Paenibacillus sp. SDF0028]
METFRFGNGVRLIIDNMPSSTSVSIGFFLKMGSKYENKSNSGISHFIEHLLIKQEKDGIPVVELLEDTGVSINAFTTKEYLCVYSKCLPEYCTRVTNILLDILLNPQFIEVQLETEKKVIQSEIARYQDNFYETVQSNLIRTMFNDHPLSMDILGSEDNIKGITTADLEQYYDSHFSTEEMVISISGKVNGGMQVEKIKNIISNIRKKTKNNKRSIPELIITSAEEITYRRTYQNFFCFGYPTISYLHKDIVKLLTLVQILGVGSRSVLAKKMRGEEGLVYSLHASAVLYKEGGVLLFKLSSPFKNGMDRILSVFKSTIYHVVQKGIPDGDFLRAINTIKSHMIFSSENNQYRMLESGKRLLLGIETEKHFDVFDFDKSFALFEELTVENLNAFASNQLHDEPSYSILLSN